MAKATSEHAVSPNLLNRQFKQNIPGKVLLTDITYLFYICFMAMVKSVPLYHQRWKQTNTSLQCLGSNNNRYCHRHATQTKKQQKSEVS